MIFPVTITAPGRAGMHTVTLQCVRRGRHVYIPLRVVDNLIVRNSSFKIDATTANFTLSGSTEQAIRAGFRQSCLDLNLKIEQSSQSELNALKKLGMLGKNAPVAGLLSTDNACLLLENFGLIAAAASFRENVDTFKLSSRWMLVQVGEDDEEDSADGKGEAMDDNKENTPDPKSAKKLTVQKRIREVEEFKAELPLSLQEESYYSLRKRNRNALSKEPASQLDTLAAAASSSGTKEEASSSTVDHTDSNDDNFNDENANYANDRGSKKTMSKANQSASAKSKQQKLLNKSAKRKYVRTGLYGRKTAAPITAASANQTSSLKMLQTSQKEVTRPPAVDEVNAFGKRHLTEYTKTLMERDRRQMEQMLQLNLKRDAAGESMSTQDMKRRLTKRWRETASRVSASLFGGAHSSSSSKPTPTTPVALQTPMATAAAVTGATITAATITTKTTASATTGMKATATAAAIATAATAAAASTTTTPALPTPPAPSPPPPPPSTTTTFLSPSSEPLEDSVSFSSTLSSSGTGEQSLSLTCSMPSPTTCSMLKQGLVSYCAMPGSNSHGNNAFVHTMTVDDTNPRWSQVSINVIKTPPPGSQEDRIVSDRLHSSSSGAHAIAAPHARSPAHVQRKIVSFLHRPASIHVMTSGGRSLPAGTFRVEPSNSSSSSLFSSSATATPTIVVAASEASLRDTGILTNKTIRAPFHSPMYLPPPSRNARSLGKSTDTAQQTKTKVAASFSYSFATPPHKKGLQDVNSVTEPLPALLGSVNPCAEKCDSPDLVHRSHASGNLKRNRTCAPVHATAGSALLPAYVGQPGKDKVLPSKIASLRLPSSANEYSSFSSTSSLGNELSPHEHHQREEPFEGLFEHLSKKPSLTFSSSLLSKDDNKASATDDDVHEMNCSPPLSPISQVSDLNGTQSGSQMFSSSPCSSLFTFTPPRPFSPPASTFATSSSSTSSSSSLSSSSVLALPSTSTRHLQFSATQTVKDADAVYNQLCQSPMSMSSISQPTSSFPASPFSSFSSSSTPYASSAHSSTPMYVKLCSSSGHHHDSTKAIDFTDHEDDKENAGTHRVNMCD